MLFGDPDVEGAIRESLVENVDAGARWHRRRDTDDLLVLFGFLDEALAEHVLIGGCIRLGLGLGTGGDVELDHGVVLVGGGFGGAVTLALLRHDVDEDRAFLHVAHVLQNRQQMVEIVAVDRTDIVEAEFLEQRAAVHHEAAGIFFNTVRAVGEDFRQTLVDLLRRLAQRAIGFA